MHRDLLDALRCPAAHEESWLVVMVHDAHDAMLTHADLACPLCGGAYVVRDTRADFRIATDHGTSDSAGTAVRILHDLDMSREAALLGMTETTQSAVVFGASQVRGETQATLVIGERLPLGAGTMAAALVDVDHATPANVQEAARVVRSGGRIVAPAHMALPEGVRELARDAEQWVAEVTARASGLIALRRRPPDVAD